MRNIGMGISQRKDGRWEVRYITHYDINGKACHKSFYGKTRKEALEKLALFKVAKIENKVNIGVSFGDVIYSWLDEIKGSVGEDNYSKYYKHFIKYILNTIGTVSMNNMNYECINCYFHELIVNGDIRTNTQLTNSALEVIRYIVLSSIKYANEKKLCDLTVYDPVKEEDTNDSKVLNDLEYERFEKYLIRSVCDKNIGLLLCLYMGYTINEICELKWKNIDIDNREIKFNKDIRRIPMYFISYLKEFKLPDHYYVVNSQVEPLNTRTYYAFFKKVLFYCNIRNISFGVLKNTFLERQKNYKPEMEEYIEKTFKLQQRVRMLEKEVTKLRKENSQLKSAYNK